MTSARSRQAPPIRVLHLARWVHVAGGGIRSYLASIAAALEGSDVLLRAASVAPSHPPDHLPDVPHTGELGSADLVNAWRFWRWVRRGVTESDVVHIHGVFGWAFVLGGIACALSGTPYIVSPHGAFSPWFMARKPFKKDLFLKLFGLPLLRRAAAVVATSANNAEEIRAIGERLHVITVTPGVQVPPAPTVRFLSETPSADRLRVLYLGRLDLVKDVPTLLHAVHHLRQRGVDADLQIVGWGTPEANAEAAAVICRLRLEEHVHFRGYLDGDDKREALETADVMAMPSHSENFSFATAEALAVGLPVIVTSGVAMARLIADNRCGHVVPPGDVEALSDALMRFADPTHRRELALWAHATAQRELSLNAMSTALQAVYRAAFDKRGQSPE